MTPEQIGEALKELEHPDGTLLPKDVIEAARSPQHILHDYFEWDDARAGHLHRIDQARGLIKRYRVTVETSKRLYQIPRYLRDPGRHGGDAGYRRADALSAPDQRSALVGELRRLGGLLDRTAGAAAALGFADHAEAIEAMANSAREAAATLTPTLTTA